MRLQTMLLRRDAGRAWAFENNSALNYLESALRLKAHLCVGQEGAKIKAESLSP